MGIFKRKGFRVVRFILLLLVGAAALYFLFRGIMNDVIVSGIK